MRSRQWQSRVKALRHFYRVWPKIGAEVPTIMGEAGRRYLVFLRKNDPIRYEKLAIIGTNGTQIRLYKKTFYFVYLLNWKTKYIESEMTHFSPIILCLSLLVT